MTTRIVMTILEDDPVQVAAIRYSIKTSLPDCVLRLEQDGRSFLVNFIRNPPPDLLVLDINVPVMSGLDVLRKIRERKDLDWLPIVMFSTDDSTSTRLAANQAGANGFELKPDLSRMGVALKDIVDRYAYKGESREILTPLMVPSLPPGVSDNTWGGLDDLLNDL